MPNFIKFMLSYFGYIRNAETLPMEADRGHKLSLPTCRFPVVASELLLHSRWTSGITKWMDGSGVVRINKMLILLCLKEYELVFKPCSRSYNLGQSC